MKYHNGKISGMPERRMTELLPVMAGNCPRCWHPVDRHGETGCNSATPSGGMLDLEGCTCDKTAGDIAALVREATQHIVSTTNPAPVDTTHECPGPGCKQRVEHDMLACRKHWYQVSPAVRSAVWKAWHAGNLEAHAHACHLAVRQMRP